MAANTARVKGALKPYRPSAEEWQKCQEKLTELEGVEKEIEIHIATEQRLFTDIRALSAREKMLTERVNEYIEAYENLENSCKAVELREWNLKKYVTQLEKQLSQKETGPININIEYQERIKELEQQLKQKTDCSSIHTQYEAKIKQLEYLNHEANKLIKKSDEEESDDDTVADDKIVQEEAIHEQYRQQIKALTDQLQTRKELHNESIQENLRLKEQLVLKEQMVEKLIADQLQAESEPRRLSPIEFGLETEIPDLLPSQEDTLSRFKSVIRTEDFDRWSRGESVVMRSLFRITEVDELSEIRYSALVTALEGATTLEKPISKMYIYAIIKRALRVPIQRGGSVKGLRLST